MYRWTQTRKLPNSPSSSLLFFDVRFRPWMNDRSWWHWLFSFPLPLPRSMFFLSFSSSFSSVQINLMDIRFNCETTTADDVILIEDWCIGKTSSTKGKMKMRKREKWRRRRRKERERISLFAAFTLLFTLDLDFLFILRSTSLSLSSFLRYTVHLLCNNNNKIENDEWIESDWEKEAFLFFFLSWWMTPVVRTNHYLISLVHSLFSTRFNLFTMTNRKLSWHIPLPSSPLNISGQIYYFSSDQK